MTFFCSEDKSFILYKGNSQQISFDINQKVDMIFADPPYFLSNGGKKIQGNKMVSVDKGDWDKYMSEEEIDQFNDQWISACRKLLKESGTIWVCGTFHNIFSVEKALKHNGFHIINIITWQKTEPTPTWGNLHFNFSSEYIIWARKSSKITHYFDIEEMRRINGGKDMPDVWKLPTVGLWEKHMGRHPTQKPLGLLYRIILASTRPGELVFDPFAGSCTTGIASNLLGRNFIGLDQSREYLQLGIRRKHELEDRSTFDRMIELMAENIYDTMVLVNHSRMDTHHLMIEKGICYLRSGDSKGSVLIKPGFENLQYVVLHTNGNHAKMYKLKKKGCFQIWSKETLEQYGFSPSHAKYYIVLHFDNSKETLITKDINLQQGKIGFTASIRPLVDFLDKGEKLEVEHIYIT